MTSSVWSHPGGDLLKYSVSERATLSPPREPSTVSPPPRVPVPEPGRGGRIALVVTGCVGLLLSLGVTAAGSTLLGVHVASRDPAGFVMSGEDHFATDTYALTSESFTIHSDAPTVMAPETLVGGRKVQVTGSASTPVFAGVALTDDVADYLADVRHAEVVDLASRDTGAAEPVYDVTEGHSPTKFPAELDIWAVQASGPGTVSLEWPDDEGDWTLVVMNADGSREVAADIAVDATVQWLGWVSHALLIGGTLGLVLALTTLYVGLQAGEGRPSGSNGRQVHT